MVWESTEKECGIQYRDLVSELRRDVEEARNLIVEWNREGVGGWFQVATYSQKIDGILRTLFKRVFQGAYPHYSIVALGGYGRKELNLQSDVDLMFLYLEGQDEIDDRVLQGVQCLWDLGLQVGHSYRSVDEALSMAMEDMTVKTSYLDARLLGGSLNPFVSFMRGVARYVITPDKEAFLDSLYQWTLERHKRFGASMYLLEPNIKEGPGNLRDIHTVMWAAKTVYGITLFRDLKRKGLLTPLEYESLERALDFVWRVRNDVHAIRGRKNDVLSLDIQPEVAHNLGFRDTRQLMSVEHFMREYYSRVRDIRRISRAFMLRTMEEMGMKSPGVSTDNMSLLREVMERSFPTPAYFLQEVRRLQEKGVDLLSIPKGFWVPPLHWRVENFNSPEVRDALIQILNAPKAHQVLRFLHEIGFMERLFPRWERLTSLMQYDLYHRYTVDEHTLVSVQSLEELEDDADPQLSHLKEAYGRYKDKKYLLLLAALFHDIGKGKGGGHALRGARIATNIMLAMGFNEEEGDTVHFLVRHHTTMAQMALRRDSTDPRVAMELADLCKTTERLEMLYLLTYADLRGVGPDVWTDWKGVLILDLYMKSRDCLEREEAVTWEVDEATFSMMVREIHRHVGTDVSPEEIEEELSQFDERYLLQVQVEKMSGHFRLLKEAKEKGLGIAYHHDHDAGYTEVTVSKKEHMGDFCRVVGVISSHRLNILSSWVFPRKDGYCIYIIHVNDSYFMPITDERVWRKVEEEMELAFQGELDLDEIISTRKGRHISRKARMIKVRTRISLDNNISDLYSVIEVKAQDKVGLLYRITSALYVLGVNIHMAKVSTEGNRAVDAFYVTKDGGGKLTEREFNIVSRLLREAIDSDKTPKMPVALLQN